MNYFYQEMQNSDEVWLGEVPSRWKSYRIKDITRLSPNFSNGTPDKEELCSVIPMEKVSEKGEIISDNVEEYSFITSGLTNFEAGDVIFAKITPCMENGKGAYVEKLRARYAFGSTEFHVIRPRYMIDGKFLYYYTYNSVYRDYAEVNMTGAAGQKRVSSRFINYTRIFLPDTHVQRRIAAYLDKTCAAIDNVIEAKQKQLEILDVLRKSIITKAVTIGLDKKAKRKDSGHIWIGRISQEWKVEKLKYVTDLIVDGTHFTPDYIEEGVPFLRVTDIQNSQIDQNKVKRISEEDHRELCKRANPKAGDILLSKNGTIGLTKVVEWNWEFSIFVSLCLIRLRKFLSPYFFRYYFESDVVDQQLFESSKRTSVTNLHLVKIREMRIAFPRLDEQQTIVTFLDTKCTELDKLKENIQQQISTLEQYRKSLIHECVTGKRRVNEDHAREQK